MDLTEEINYLNKSFIEKLFDKYTFTLLFISVINIIHLLIIKNHNHKDRNRNNNQQRINRLNTLFRRIHRDYFNNNGNSNTNNNVNNHNNNSNQNNTGNQLNNININGIPNIIHSNQ